MRLKAWLTISYDCIDFCEESKKFARILSALALWLFISSLRLNSVSLRSSFKCLTEGMDPLSLFEILIDPLGPLDTILSLMDSLIESKPPLGLIAVFCLKIGVLSVFKVGDSSTVTEPRLNFLWGTVCYDITGAGVKTLEPVEVLRIGIFCLETAVGEVASDFSGLELANIGATTTGFYWDSIIIFGVVPYEKASVGCSIASF